MVDLTRTSPKPVVTDPPVAPKPGTGDPLPEPGGSGSTVPTGPMIIPHVEMPPGWSNSRRALARHSNFSRGEGICRFLGEHGFHYVYPVMRDDYNTYLIRGKKTGEDTLTYFVWDPMVGTVFKIASKDLKEIVDIMGRSVLALDMVELGDADSKTTDFPTVEPVSPG